MSCLEVGGEDVCDSFLLACVEVKGRSDEMTVRVVPGQQLRNVDVVAFCLFQELWAGLGWLYVAQYCNWVAR